MLRVEEVLNSIRPYLQADGGDIDLDASTDAFGGKQNAREINIEELRVRTWEKRDTALCLLVDRSGSMGGAPLATSAVAVPTHVSVPLLKTLHP